MLIIPFERDQVTREGKSCRGPSYDWPLIRFRSTVPLPYHRLRDDEDLDEELERISSNYGKEKGFSLRRAAFKLEGLRAQLIKRNKKTPSIAPDAVNAGPTSDVVHRDYEPRRLPSFGAMSSSVESNGGEGEVASDSP